MGGSTRTRTVCSPSTGTVETIRLVAVFLRTDVQHARAAGIQSGMSYLLAGLLFIAILAIAVALLTVSAKRHGRNQPRASVDQSYGEGLPGSDIAILAPDPDSPLGDTSEHAGGQRDGETVSGQDAARSGGSRRPVGGGYAGTSGIGDHDDRRAPDAEHNARPLVGGEGEGVRRMPARSDRARR
jgi:hypothetical protein